MRQSHKIEEVKDRGPKQLKNTDYMNKCYIMSLQKKIGTELYTLVCVM